MEGAEKARRLQKTRDAKRSRYNKMTAEEKADFHKKKREAKKRGTVR
jgi:hypothetical protein